MQNECGVLQEFQPNGKLAVDTMHMQGDKIKRRTQIMESLGQILYNYCISYMWCLKFVETYTSF